MGKTTVNFSKSATATIAVFLIVFLATASPVRAQEAWENAFNDLQSQIFEQMAYLENLLNTKISEVSSDVSDASYRMDNLYAFIDDLLGASAFGKEFAVYALTDEGLEPVAPLSVAPPLFDNASFSPVYVKQNGMLMLWVVDKDLQTPVNGTLDIGMSMFSFSDGTLDPWVMMMLLQQGGNSMFGQSMFSFPISAGVATVPAMSGFGDTWMATVSAPEYKNFQFVIKIGESPTTPPIVISSTGALVRGEPAVVVATRGGELVDGTLVLSDGTEGTGGMVSFVVPDTSSFSVSLKEGDKIIKTQTFYTTGGETAHQSSGGSDGYLVVFSVIFILFFIYCIYKRRRGEPLLGRWFKKPHFPR